MSYPTEVRKENNVLLIDFGTQYVKCSVMKEGTLIDDILLLPNRIYSISEERAKALAQEQKGEITIPTGLFTQKEIEEAAAAIIHEADKPIWKEIPVEDALAGDIVLMRIANLPLHTGVVVAPKHMLHTEKNIDSMFEYTIRCKYGYVLDFAIPELKIDIECNGERWHPEGNSHDKKRKGYLESKGWKVLPFTGTEIKEDIQSCINKIQIEIQGGKENGNNKSKN